MSDERPAAETSVTDLAAQLAERVRYEMSGNGYELAAEWRDKFKVADAELADLREKLAAAEAREKERLNDAHREKLERLAGFIESTNPGYSNALRVAIDHLAAVEKERDEALAKVEKYEKRLEIDHCFKPVKDVSAVGGTRLERVEIPPEKRGQFPDAVECREATIACHEMNEERLRATIASQAADLTRLRELAEPFRKWAANPSFRHSHDGEHMGTMWDDDNDEVVDASTPTFGELKALAAFLAAAPAPEPDAGERRVEAAVAAETERCARVAENGSFLHDEAPTAKFGREVAAAIRRTAKKP